MQAFSDWIDDMQKFRMLQGEKKHGPLNLDTDPRAFIEEGIEELIDCLNYLEIARDQGKLPFCKWITINKDIRFVILRLVCKSSIYGEGLDMDLQEISCPE